MMMKYSARDLKNEIYLHQKSINKSQESYTNSQSNQNMRNQRNVSVGLEQFLNSKSIGSKQSENQNQSMPILLEGKNKEFQDKKFHTIKIVKKKVNVDIQNLNTLKSGGSTSQDDEIQDQNDYKENQLSSRIEGQGD